MSAKVRGQRLHLGGEIEFMSDYCPPNVQAEYYNGQYEINDFHVINSTVAANLRHLFEWASRIRDFSERGPIYLSRTIQTGAGPVFSGVHLHIQVRGQNQRDALLSPNDKMAMGNMLSEIVLADVMRYYGVTFRCMASHHLHGAMRDSAYRYKQKRKFMPVTYHPRFDTYEVRCIEPQMLYTPDGKVALKSILERAYSYLCGVQPRIPPQWRMLARRMITLPADLNYQTNARKYTRLMRDLAEVGANMKFTMRVGSGREIRVAYDDVIAHNREITVNRQLYRMDSQHGERPISVEALDVERGDFETIEDWRYRIERRREELSTFDHDDVGRPVEPSDTLQEPMRSFRRNAYRRLVQAWENNNPYSVGNPFRRGTPEAFQWEHEQAVRRRRNTGPTHILNSNLLSYELRVGDVWANRDGSVSTVTRDGGLYQTVRIPVNIDRMTNRGHNDAARLLHPMQFLVNVNGMRGTPRRLDEIEEAPEPPAHERIVRRPGDIWRCRARRGSHVGYAVVARDYRFVYSSAPPSRRRIPDHGTLTDESRIMYVPEGSIRIRADYDEFGSLYTSRGRPTPIVVDEIEADGGNDD